MWKILTRNKTKKLIINICDSKINNNKWYYNRTQEETIKLLNFLK